MSSLAASRTTTARPSAGRAARSARASQARRVVARASETDEVAMLTKMLELAKERAEAPAAAAPASSDSGDYDGPAFNVLTFNAISSVGLERFPKGRYAISGDGSSFGAEPMAIMLRSHKLQESDVDPSVRGIVRCGAGTNNCNVPKMTELGIPVFNTPGANANAVKELVICALLLASRGIYEGITHVENVILPEEKMEDEKIAKRIEADKKMFVGNEIAGKTIGVVGLGQIGARVVEAALALGMNVIGYDPVLSVDAAMRLPGDRMTRVTDLKELYAGSDYISLHVPYIPGVTHHLIDAEALEACKPGVSFLNFARGEIVDGEALKKFWDAGKGGKYISDFSDPFLNGHPKHVVLPHLGASTAEAEENSAAMAADTIMNFLETGDVVNSVNFPTTITGSREGHARLCVVHENSPGVLGQLTTKLGDKGYNITQQINNSRGDIAYTVIDLQENPEDPDALQQEIAGSIPEVISMRFLSDVFENKMGSPGTYFYVRWA